MPDLKRVSSKRRRSGSRKLSDALPPELLGEDVDADSFQRDWGITPQKEVSAAWQRRGLLYERCAVCSPDVVSAACRRSCWTSSGQRSSRRVC